MPKAPPVKIKKESPELYFALIARELMWNAKDLRIHGVHTNGLAALAGICKLGGYKITEGRSDSGQWGTMAGFMTHFYDKRKLGPWGGPYVIFVKDHLGDYKEMTMKLTRYGLLSIVYGKDSAEQSINNFNIKKDKNALSFEEWFQRQIPGVMQAFGIAKDEAMEYLETQKEDNQNEYKGYLGDVLGCDHKFTIIPKKYLFCFLFDDDGAKKEFLKFAKEEGVSKKQMPLLLTAKELYGKIDKAKKYCVDSDALNEKEAAELESKFFEKFKGQCRPA